MPNGMCYHHGGASTGAPKGNQHAAKHGIYSKTFTPAEYDLAQAALGSVEQETALARVQLSRALKAEANADTLQDGLELVEIVRSDNGRMQTKSKKRDYYQIINTLLGRIESLEKTRQEIMSGIDSKIVESARMIICPDE